MIYDESTGKWYEVYRSFWGKLELREVVFKNIVKCPSERDFVFSKSGLKMYKIPPEPPTPQ